MQTNGIDWNTLKEAFQAACPRADLVPFAAEHGIEVNDARRMWNGFAGRPPSANAYIGLCRALGRDPLDPSSPPPASKPCGPGPILPTILGAAAFIKRDAAGQTLREASPSAGVSAATLVRAEHGAPISAQSFIALCRWLGRHPHDFVSRETITETSAQKVAA